MTAKRGHKPPKLHRLGVGQILYWLPDGKPNLIEVKVIEIGSRYAKLDNFELISLITLKGRGRGSGQAFLRREDCNNEIVLQELWNELMLDLQYRTMPIRLTREKIRQVRAILEIEHYHETPACRDPKRKPDL